MIKFLSKVFLIVFCACISFINGGHCTEENFKNPLEITHLDLREDTTFTDEQLIQYKNLTSLFLGPNKIITLKSVETLTNLKILDLSGNEQIRFWVVKKLTNLMSLDLTKNNRIPMWCLGSLPELKMLAVTLRTEKEDIDFALQELSKLHPLKRLVINTSVPIDTKGLSHHKLEIKFCEETVKSHEK